MTRTAVAAIFLLAACGGGGGGADGGGDDDIDGAVAGLVPDPGNAAIPFSWPDTEPNDTPQQAVPLGTSVNAGEATWFDGTAESGSLGGTDRADFFVFRSSPQGGMFHAAPCWDGTAAPNLIDFYVYKVVDGHVDSMAGSSTATDDGCENLTATADVTMEASTVYLLELRALGAGMALYGA
ncbi:MAG TPA: hypothetical protein VL172_10210 [Kofleriaceae bacterium]|nr:hypothetical protein [Kofleriaceae bacterium]